MALGQIAKKKIISSSNLAHSESLQYIAIVVYQRATSTSEIVLFEDHHSESCF